MALENIMSNRQTAIRACFYKYIFDLEKAQKSIRVSVPQPVEKGHLLVAFFSY